MKSVPIRWFIRAFVKQHPYLNMHLGDRVFWQKAKKDKFVAWDIYAVIYRGPTIEDDNFWCEIKHRKYPLSIDLYIPCRDPYGPGFGEYFARKLYEELHQFSMYDWSKDNNRVGKIARTTLEDWLYRKDMDYYMYTLNFNVVEGNCYPCEWNDKCMCKACEHTKTRKK